MGAPAQAESGVISARAWLFIHNVVAHPLMELLPKTWGDAFHDWTADLASLPVPGSGDANQMGTPEERRQCRII